MTHKLRKFFDVEDVDKYEGMKIAKKYGCIFDSTQPNKAAVVRRLNRLYDDLREDGIIATPDEFEGEVGQTCRFMLDVLEGKIDENGHRRVNYDEFSCLLYRLVDSIIENEDEIDSLKSKMRSWRTLAATFNNPNQRRGKCSKLRQDLVAFLPQSYVVFHDYENMTYNELRRLAKKQGYKYDGNPTKDELLDDLTRKSSMGSLSE